MEYVLSRFTLNSIFWKYFKDDSLVSSGVLDLNSYHGGEVNLSGDLYFDSNKGFYRKDGDTDVFLLVRVNYLSIVFERS